MKWYGLHPTEKIQTLPEDGIIRAGLRLSLQSKFMKQEVYFICQEYNVDEKNMLYGGTQKITKQ